MSAYDRWRLQSEPIEKTDCLCGVRFYDPEGDRECCKCNEPLCPDCWADAVETKDGKVCLSCLDDGLEEEDEGNS